MAKHQSRTKQDSKKKKLKKTKTIEKHLKLRYRDRQLISFLLLEKILNLIINLILMSYENDYYNSNSLYFLFVYAEL